MPAGRPTDYREEYCQQLVDFFSIEPNRKEKVSVAEAFDKKDGKVTFKKEEWKIVPNTLPTIQKFCDKIGTTRKTLLEWTTKHPEFLNAYEIAKEKYKDFLIENGLMNLYNGAFAIFVAKNTTDMKDKTELEHSGSVDLMGLLQKAKDKDGK